MAKKTDKQPRTIPGTADAPTAKVENHGQAYVAVLVEWQRLGRDLTPKHDALMTAMEEDSIIKFECDGHELEYITTATSKVKCKKLKEE